MDLAVNNVEVVDRLCTRLSPEHLAISSLVSRTWHAVCTRPTRWQACCARRWPDGFGGLLRCYLTGGACWGGLCCAEVCCRLAVRIQPSGNHRLQLAPLPCTPRPVHGPQLCDSFALLDLAPARWDHRAAHGVAPLAIGVS